MLATPHTAMGILIAYLIPNPYVALPLALLSHFALDLIPHWDFFSFRKEITREIKIKVVGDFLIGLTLGLFFVIRALPNLNEALRFTGCCVLANLPDALESPAVFLNYQGEPVATVMNLQRKLHSRLKYPEGLITQALLLILFGLVLFV